jgi:hypothetical protein
METDYSKEIYNKYYNIKGKIVEITLKDNSVLEGKLVGFFHGDKETGESFIEKWHFVDEKKIQAYKYGLGVSMESNQDVDKIIDQKDIKNVRFRD